MRYLEIEATLEPCLLSNESIMENSEELAQPQRRFENHAIIIFQVVFSTLSGF